jgi:nucleotide-binding universal stress UspA family protein
MADVILVVSGHFGPRTRLTAAAQRLAALTGQGRVRMLALPGSVAVPDEPGHPVPVQHLQAGADVAAEVEARGSRADFMVLAQPAAQDDRATRDAFRAALFRTERPLLMVPSGRPVEAFGVRVAVAWRDDAQTLKALIPAIRLLGQAQEVHLLAGVRGGATTPAIPSVLVEHGVPATLHVLAIGSPPFGGQLLGLARELGADMLIMGAYAHSPLREMLLGGVTRHMLAHADLPVLMRH